MGKAVRREYVEIPDDYWESSIEEEYVIKREK